MSEGEKRLNVGYPEMATALYVRIPKIEEDIAKIEEGLSDTKSFARSAVDGVNDCKMILRGMMTRADVEKLLKERDDAEDAAAWRRLKGGSASIAAKVMAGVAVALVLATLAAVGINVVRQTPPQAATKAATQ